jgi:hypothetical protein
MIRLKFIFLVSILMLSLKRVQAQQFVESWDGTPNLERHQLTLNFLTPGIRYELGLFKNVSASSSFTPGLGYYGEGYAFGFVWNTRVRYYLNFQERYRANKNVKYNSADYIAAARTMFWEPLNISDNLDGLGEYSLAFWGGVYGIQRTNEKGFNYNIEMGLGYYEGFGIQGGFGTLLNFTFGWVATNRKVNKLLHTD